MGQDWLTELKKVAVIMRYGEGGVALYLHTSLNLQFGAFKEQGVITKIRLAFKSVIKAEMLKQNVSLVIL